jgi:nucleotide-binding universal stress UspA family protein
LAKQAQETVSHATETIRKHGLNAEAVTRSGDPRSQIVEEARTWRADLLLLGSHGRTGIARWLIGSVAEHVVRHAPCSVEVARSMSAGA